MTSADIKTRIFIVDKFDPIRCPHCPKSVQFRRVGHDYLSSYWLSVRDEKVYINSLLEVKGTDFVSTLFTDIKFKQTRSETVDFIPGDRIFYIHNLYKQNGSLNTIFTHPAIYELIIEY